MRITFYSNATCTYEQDGFTLLADPWLTETAFKGSWTHLHPLKTKPQDLLDVDALYISHIHEDHLSPGTLKHFRRDIPIFTLRDKLGICIRKLEELGFIDVRGISDGDWSTIGPFKLTMFSPFVKHQYVDDELGNFVDSACLFEATGHRVLNANDNGFDPESAERFRRAYGTIDVAQLNWNSASFYPACFMNLSHEDKLVEAKRLSLRNLENLAAVSKALNPGLVSPFAGAFKLAAHLDHLNQYLGTTTAEEAVEYLTDRGISAFSLLEGEAFDVI